MADDQHIWIEIENENEVDLGIAFQQKIMHFRAKRLLDELAEEGMYFLAKNVPHSPPYSKGYTTEHMGRTDVNWDAGVGEFSATVGIKAGHSYHPVYVNRGTGVYGPFIKMPYTTKPPGGYMHFFASRIGKRIAKQEVKGQRAQHFLYTTFRELQVFAGAQIHSKAF